MKNFKALKYSLLIFLTVFVIACGQQDGEPTIPPNVLSEEQYIDLLVDLSLAESATNINVKSLSGPKFDSAYAFNPIREHNISESVYDSTVAFYSRNPKLYKKLYEQVLERLNKMQVEREKNKKDTVVGKVEKKDSAIVKTTYDVILKEAGERKLGVIKVVKNMTGLGLKEAKDLVDGAPKTVKAGIEKKEALRIEKALKKAGAKAEVKLTGEK